MRALSSPGGRPPSISHHASREAAIVTAAAIATGSDTARGDVAASTVA